MVKSEFVIASAPMGRAYYLKKKWTPNDMWTEQRSDAQSFSTRKYAEDTLKEMKMNYGENSLLPYAMVWPRRDQAT